MPYLDQDGFAQRFTQRELDQLLAAGTGGVGAGTVEFDRAAEDATETVDSYLAAIPNRAFALPLTIPPARIVGVTADLVRYELWAQRASEEVQRRRDQAIDYLKDLVAGRAVLIVDATLPEAPALNPAGRVAYSSASRVFTARTLAGFVGEATCDDPLGGLRGCD